MNINATSGTALLAPSLALNNAGTPSFNVESLSESVRAVDKGGSSEQVNISSKARFLFELNTYANTLSEKQRHQFARALEAAGDPIFSQGFLDTIRHSTSFGAVTIEPKDIFSGEASDENGVIAMYGGPIPYNGQRVNYLDDYASMGKAQLNKTLGQILSDTTDELSQQDRASIQSSFERAIYSSFNALSSDFDIFSTNYDFLIAQDVIGGFDLNEQTSSNLTTLLSDIKKNNRMVNLSSLAETLQDAKKFPQHASNLLASAQKTREGIELNNELQSYFQGLGSNILESERYFTELMQGSRSIETSNTGDYPDMFDYYQTHENQFKRGFIEQDWSAGNAHNNDQLVMGQLGEPEKVVAELASKYIEAVNAYISTQKHFNTK